MQAANSTCRSETQSENNQSGAVGNGSDPEWLSELLLRTRVTATAEATTQSAEGKQNSHDLDVLSEVTGSCLDQDYLEHVLQQAGGNVQVGYFFLCTALVRNWNWQVDPNDIVIHMGLTRMWCKDCSVLASGAERLGATSV